MDRAAALVSFVCRSHSRGTPTITVHEGQWAYCPGGFVDTQEGHVWEAKAPTSVDELESQRVGRISEHLARAV